MILFFFRNFKGLPLTVTFLKETLAKTCTHSKNPPFTDGRLINHTISITLRVRTFFTTTVPGSCTLRVYLGCGTRLLGTKRCLSPFLRVNLIIQKGSWVCGEKENREDDFVTAPLLYHSPRMESTRGHCSPVLPKF